MLTPAFLMRDRATLQKRAGMGLSGPEYAPGVEIACRAEPVWAVDVPSGGRSGGGSVLLPPSCEAAAGDRLVLSGRTWLLAKTRPVVLPDGRVSHIEGELL